MTFFDFVDKHPGLTVFAGIGLFFLVLCVLGMCAELLNSVINRNKPEPKE